MNRRWLGARTYQPIQAATESLVERANRAVNFSQMLPVDSAMIAPIRSRALVSPVALRTALMASFVHGVSSIVSQCIRSCEAVSAALISATHSAVRASSRIFFVQ